MSLIGSLREQIGRSAGYHHQHPSTLRNRVVETDLMKMGQIPSKLPSVLMFLVT